MTLKLKEAMKQACAAEPGHYVSISFELNRHISQHEENPWETRWSVWNGRLQIHSYGDTLEEALASFIAKSNGVNLSNELDQASVVDDFVEPEDAGVVPQDRPGDGFAPEEM